MKQILTHAKIRENLAAAYRICAMLGLDDHTYTHLSARLPGEDSYFIFPFGQLYEEVTAGSLMRVGINGDIHEGEECTYNQTGYAAHGAVYRARPEVNAIFHTHTLAGIAVGCHPDGLLPISQWALHFYNKIAYLPYGSLIVDTYEQGDAVADMLADKNVMLMRNHGVLTLGQTIHEALFYTYHLELACKTQVATLSSVKTPVVPSPEVCARSVSDLLSFETDIGHRDWVSWLRKLDRLGSSYKSMQPLL
ncbi:MAG: class II aldolase/adducin family protein [Alphaproteobacteria bacterium]|nr:MAG: class II aldolase/adducin family protein [Alphaproteobacteria bacterium]